MQEIPVKISKELEDNTLIQWIEEQDRIYDEADLTDKLKSENQYLFWQKNCDIRMALDEIETTIRTTSKLSVRLSGWSEIARKANCDRNTLKHPERFKWVQQARERLISLIHKKLDVPAKLEVVMTTEDVIRKLENELCLSKTESAKWFVKFEESERENKLLRRAIERQMATNNALNEQIVSLKKLSQLL